MKHHVFEYASTDVLGARMDQSRWVWPGLIAGVVALYGLSLVPDFRLAWITHFAAFGFALTAAVFVFMLQRHERQEVAPSIAFFIGFGTAILLGIAACVASLFLVSGRAEKIAHQAPYCIQIADNQGDSYKPVESLLDLSALTLWSLSRFQHHSVLVVQDDDLHFFHWSYRRRNFDAGVVNGATADPIITCVPRRNFVAELPALFPQKSTSRYVRFSASDAFRIPDVYQPKWSGGKALLIATSAPNFQPLKVSWNDLPPAERDSKWLFVQWNPEWVLSLMKTSPGSNAVEESVEFGLTKSKTVIQGRDGKEYVDYRYLAYTDGHGINTTIIICSMPSEAIPKSCQHRFINKGRHFYFRHRPDDVVDWQRMQQRILKLMESFQIDGGS